ncbi:myb/SANT-like DNA-binding domain-containing protein 4 [Camponotus floridanus]|uniref:myb/SANT-like DNA-binding domain-containing protein 4 n=1 Tax=Camponotus floridanus TaxID=104421 RepID=UPI000DC6A570|nr:myb/SANT-like DNA-binding domain-containing protein 4 [Camponotus floridanus]
MTELKKRERGSNFSNKETETLVLIVQQFKNIIECKRTDATTWREKDAAWEKVAAEFNSNSGEIFRTKKTLKAKYEDLKKSIKKKLAHNRMEKFKTGGGKPEIRPLTGIEENILSMLPSSVEGLPSIWDSDRETCKEKATPDITPEMQSVENNINIDIDNMYVDMNTPIDIEIDMDLMNNENKENEETKTSGEKNVNEKNNECKRKIDTIKETGISILRRTLAPELRTKRLKKTHQELEINTERLKTAKVENELKTLQKQIEEAKLEKLLQTDSD